MALRAGYYGVKKSILEAISRLSGAKIIKTIGDGLKLTTAGKLSCDIDSETMEFKNGKLSSKGSGMTKKSVFSTLTSAAATIELTDSIASGTFIEFILTDGSTYDSSYLVPLETFKNLASGYVLGVWDYQYSALTRTSRFSYVDDTHITIGELTGNVLLKAINVY